MKPYENEVQKDTIDTLEVKNERHKIFDCWFRQEHRNQQHNIDLGTYNQLY